MPTNHRRYQVTETPELARAIDLASKRWPGESRGRLLTRLVIAGREMLGEQLDAEVRQRRQAVVRTSGKYADAFDTNYLTELREDWAE